MLVMLSGQFTSQTPLGYLPLVVIRIRSLALTSLIVRYLLSGLTQGLMAFSATMPSGFLMFRMKPVYRVACLISLKGILPSGILEFFAPCCLHCYVDFTSMSFHEVYL